MRRIGLRMDGWMDEMEGRGGYVMEQKRKTWKGGTDTCMQET